LTSFSENSEKKVEKEEMIGRDLFFEYSLDLMVIVGFDGCFKQVSPSFERILGWKKAEVVSKPFLEFIHPEDRGRTVIEAESFKAGKNATLFENRYRCKDGSYRWISWNCHPFPQKQIVIGIGRDLTERKKAEAKLEEYKNNLEKLAEERTQQIKEQAELLDNAHEAINVRDLEGNILYWNKGAERLYGYTAQEVFGKKVQGLIFKNPAQYDKVFEEVCAKGEWNGEMEHLTKDGRNRVIDAHWSLVIDKEMKPKSIITVSTDITERKDLEQQYLRAQRLESLGTLAGGIAHDVRNIITPVMLGLGLLDKKTTEKEDHELIASLQKNLQRGADLTKQILTFARGVEVERKPVEIPRLIDEIEKMVKATFPKSIRFEKKVDPNISAVDGDVGQLHQVLINLCINARDAMPYGGKLNITAENVSIDEHYPHAEAKAGHYVSIEIKDNGAGIPPKVMDRLFEPFFTTKKQGEGTGLGLSTTRSIVKSHGGFINVYSETGMGSSFKVFLPIAWSGSARQQEEQTSDLLPGDGQTILIVDDEELIRTTTATILEKSGYKTLVAGDGAEALGAYMKNYAAIKIVLLDMAMPIMDGEVTTRALKRINPDTKIIGMSGMVESGKYKTALDMVNASISKPFTADRLLRLIANELKE